MQIIYRITLLAALSLPCQGLWAQQAYPTQDAAVAALIAALGQ